MRVRAALWLFAERFEIERGQAMQVGYSAFFSLEHIGDPGAFLLAWGRILLAAVQGLEEELIQLRRCPRGDACQVEPLLS